MEASEATQTQEPEAAEQQAAEPAPEQNEPQQQEASPDFGEQLTALTQEVQSLRGQISPEQAEGGGLYEQLAGYSEEGEPELGQEEGQQPEGELDPFDSAIRERVAEATYPILMGIEQDRRQTQLESLAEQHPELRDREVQEEIADRLGPIADRYGNEMILTDPDVIGPVLLAIKAERATASEVPAEQAASQGAQLETAAGASAPEAQLAPEEEIKQGMLGLRGGKDAFTS